MASTVASAYSIRPNPRGTVSAPLTWSELADADPEDFTVRTMPARFAEVGDPHAGLGERRHSLEPMLELADRSQ
jgi:DNA primase